jgi:four helix bundle protein
MEGIQSYRELTVWRKATDRAVQTYSLADRFPKAEIYGLRGQLTRASAAVPANIAERSARATRKDYANFISIARGSLVEAETFMILAARLGYLQEADLRTYLVLSAEVGKMLTSLRRKLLQLDPSR